MVNEPLRPENMIELNAQAQKQRRNNRARSGSLNNAVAYSLLLQLVWGEPLKKAAQQGRNSFFSTERIVDFLTCRVHFLLIIMLIDFSTDEFGRGLNDALALLSSIFFLVGVPFGIDDK